MTEVTTVNKEASINLEVPRNTALVTLPSISADTIDIRLAMHTDSIQTFLRTLRTFPDLDQLRIEGRVLNEDQRKALEQSSKYKFYLSGRLTRSGLLLPTSLRMTPETIAELLQSPFSPSSSEEDIGYKTGYFNAGDLVKQWISEGRPNDLLPIIGAINELHIGSDTLSPQRLFTMAASLHQAFVEQEESTQSLRAQINNPPGFNLYKMQTLFSKINDDKIYKEKDILHTIISQSKFPNREKLEKKSKYNPKWAE